MVKGKLSSTLEDYLEAIYRIEKEKRAARVRDISRYLGVAKSTVNAALKSLSEKELVEYEPYELIVLTRLGYEKASAIVMNHEIIRHFLRDILLLDENRSEAIACEMEHAVDREAIERFACFIAFLESAEESEAQWVSNFRKFLSNSSSEESFKDCIAEYVKKFHPDDDQAWETA